MLARVVNPSARAPSTRRNRSAHHAASAADSIFGTYTYGAIRAPSRWAPVAQRTVSTSVADTGSPSTVTACSSRWSPRGRATIVGRVSSCAEKTPRSTPCPRTMFAHVGAVESSRSPIHTSAPEASACAAMRDSGGPVIST
jgi:hypothetical protein